MIHRGTIAKMRWSTHVRLSLVNCLANWSPNKARTLTLNCKTRLSEPKVGFTYGAIFERRLKANPASSVAATGIARSVHTRKPIPVVTVFVHDLVSKVVL